MRGWFAEMLWSQQQRPSVVVASGFLLPRGGEADGEQTVQVKFVTPFWRVQVKFDAPVSASRQIGYIFYHSFMQYHRITALSCSVNALSCSGDLYLLQLSSRRHPVRIACLRRILIFALRWGVAPAGFELTICCRRRRRRMTRR